MSFGAPKISPPAVDPPPPDQGASALKIGGDNTLNQAQGALGRLALRVGAPGAS